MRNKSNKNASARKNSKETNQSRKNAARVLFFLNAILWFMYVVYIYYQMAVLNNNTRSADIVTIFVFLNGIAMLVSGIMFGGQKNRTFYFPLVVIALNMVLTILNIVELFFTFVFIIDLLILWTILPLRKNYPLYS